MASVAVQAETGPVLFCISSVFLSSFVFAMFF